MPRFSSWRRILQGEVVTVVARRIVCTVVMFESQYETCRMMSDDLLERHKTVLSAWQLYLLGRAQRSPTAANRRAEGAGFEGARSSAGVREGRPGQHAALGQPDTIPPAVPADLIGVQR
jgi:hypothetical protein